MDRRAFLRSMFATAVAVALPDLPKASAASFTDELTDRFLGMQVNGRVPKCVSVQATANGWYRVMARFSVGAPGRLDLDFSKLPGGGLRVNQGDVFSWGNQIERGPHDDMIFSGYFKPVKLEPVGEA